MGVGWFVRVALLSVMRIISLSFASLRLTGSFGRRVEVPAGAVLAVILLIILCVFWVVKLKRGDWG